MTYVISASRKTDIPAFYTEWFMNRIRAGFCHSINPYTGQVYTLSLKPQDTIAIVFWTRDPTPLLPHLAELAARGFKYYFLFTLMSYPHPIETHAPELNRAVHALQALSEHLTPDFVFWKYDPIIISSVTPLEYHVEQFGVIAHRLAGYTRRCLYSWLIMFDHFQKNLVKIAPESNITIQTLSQDNRRKLLTQLVEIAQANHIQLYSCFSEDYARVPGVQPGSCVDIGVLRTLTANPALELAPAVQLGRALRGGQPSPLAPIRALAAKTLRAIRPTPLGPCRCAASIDIGSDNTCVFGCAYCLATHSWQQAQENRQAHDPSDSLLHRPASLRGLDLGECAIPYPFELKQAG